MLKQTTVRQEPLVGVSMFACGRKILFFGVDWRSLAARSHRGKPLWDRVFFALRACAGEVSSGPLQPDSEQSKSDRFPRQTGALSSRAKVTPASHDTECNFAEEYSPARCGLCHVVTPRSESAGLAPPTRHGCAPRALNSCHRTCRVRTARRRVPETLARSGTKAETRACRHCGWRRYRACPHRQAHDEKPRFRTPKQLSLTYRHIEVRRRRLVGRPASPGLD